MAITRNVPIVAVEPACRDQCTRETEEKLVDGLMVTFMFNVVNRIANFYELQPEWNRLRRSETIRNISQRIMAASLPFQMPLADEQQEVHTLPQIADYLIAFGVERPSPVWQCLRIVPSVEFAIYQLMMVATKFSKRSSDLIREVTDVCLDRPPTTPPHLLARESLDLLVRLFREPHRMAGVDRSALALDEQTIMDLIFWVALLAAVHQLNATATIYLAAE